MVESLIVQYADLCLLHTLQDKGFSCVVNHVTNDNDINNKLTLSVVLDCVRWYH